MTESAGRSPLLYLYGSVELLVHLKRSCLLMCQDWSFLQPFLSLGQWHDGPIKQISEQDMIEGYQREYQKLPENVRLWLPFDAFLKQKGKLEAQIRASVMLHKSAQPQMTAGYSQQRFDKTAYLRLFDKATCHFGWSVLASQFTGLCVGLRQQASCFQPAPGSPVLLQAVQYGIEHPYQVSAGNPLPGAFVDVVEHQAFGEWRAIVPNRSDEPVALRLKRHDVQCIYYSVLTPEDVVQALHVLVQQDLNFRHVALYRLLPDAASWRLTAERVVFD